MKSLTSNQKEEILQLLRDGWSFTYSISKIKCGMKKFYYTRLVDQDFDKEISKYVKSKVQRPMAEKVIYLYSPPEKITYDRPRRQSIVDFVRGTK